MTDEIRTSGCVNSCAPTPSSLFFWKSRSFNRAKAVSIFPRAVGTFCPRVRLAFDGHIRPYLVQFQEHVKERLVEPDICFVNAGRTHDQWKTLQLVLGFDCASFVAVRAAPHVLILVYTTWFSLT